MKNLYLLNGSNIGNRANNLKKAKHLLNEIFGIAIKVSEIYETQAWGNIDQPNFFNQALKYETNLPPFELLKLIKDIEKKIGGDHKEKWAARMMDIDIIFYGDLVFESSQLAIPHHLMHLRNFVLMPLNEIAPSHIHPKLKVTVNQLLKSSKDKLKVTKFIPNEV